MTRRQQSLLVIGIVFAVAILCLSMDKLTAIFQISRFVTDSQTSGSNARIPMILTAFNHALYHPLGMGVYVRNPSLVVGAKGAVFAEVMAMPPHNVFGNCVAQFGFITLGLVIRYLIYILREYRCSNETQYADLYACAFWCIFASFVNSMAHNQDFLSGDFTTQMMIGILFSQRKFRNNSNGDE